jgi:serine protease Do
MIMKTPKLISLMALSAVMVFSGRQLSAQQVQERDPAGSMEHLLRRMGVPGEQQAWLGVDIADVTQAKVKELKLPGDYGAVVTEVAENSPAAKAGLKDNDVILEFGGMKVWSAAQLRQLVAETPAGRNVSLGVSRNGQRITLQVTMERPKNYSFTVNIPRINMPRGFFQFAPLGMRGRLGIEGQDLTPQLASYFGVKQGKGVLVAQVEEGSPAAKAGLKAGDCIVRVDTAEVGSIPDLRRALAQQAGGDHSVTLAIVRNGHEQSLRVELQPAWRPNPEQEAQNFTGSLERQVQQMQRQIPRIERQEKQLESCLVALESHLFKAQLGPRQNSPMASGPHGTLVATGPGCPWNGAASGN